MTLTEAEYVCIPSMQQPPAFLQHVEHFKSQMINMPHDLSQQVFITIIFSITLFPILLKLQDSQFNLYPL